MWKLSIDNGKVIAAISTDYACGITGSLWEWFLSYLTIVVEFVEISGTKSDLRKVEYGVPRGSLVGPRLFQFTSD